MHGLIPSTLIANQQRPETNIASWIPMRAHTFYWEGQLWGWNYGTQAVSVSITII